MFQRNKQQVPVDIGEEMDVTIEAVGEKGDGVAKVKGFVLFIPGVKQGERCRVRITKVLQKVGFAERIGDAESPEPPPEERPRQVQREMPPVPEAESYEDTEDFGEEEQ